MPVHIHDALLRKKISQVSELRLMDKDGRNIERVIMSTTTRLKPPGKSFIKRDILSIQRPLTVYWVRIVYPHTCKLARYLDKHSVTDYQLYLEHVHFSPF